MGTFHLFRLKEELEQDLHSYLLEYSDEYKKIVPTSLNDAISKLKLISEKNVEVRDGPYLIEHQENDIDLFLSKLFSIIAIIITAPPIKTLKGGISLKNNHTHIGAHKVSISINKPTVAELTVLEPIVIQIKLNANCGTPKRKPISRSCLVN